MIAQRRKRSFSPSVENMESRRLLNATYTVTNLSGDPNLQGSLPWAVVASNETQSTPQAPNVINFSSGVAGLTIARTTGPMAITQSVNINGSGQTLTGSGNSQMFTMYGLNTTANFYNLTMTHCRADGNGSLGNDSNGGAIDNWGYGNIVVSACTFTDDTAAGAGGAVCGNRGNVTINGSVFQQDAAGYYGGAIATSYGVNLTFAGGTSYLYYNLAGVNGGAVEVQSGHYFVTAPQVSYYHNFVTGNYSQENDIFFY